MIKAVIFDYGGVTTRFGGGTDLSERLSAVLEITPKQAVDLIHSDWRQLITGKVSEQQFWEKLETRFDKKIDPNQRFIWNTWEQMKPEQEMVQLVRQLKMLKFTVDLLSNVTPYTANDIRRNRGYDMFDHVTLSHETGFAKPDTQIYRLALSELKGLQPSEVVYVDDQQKCLTPAEELGMHAIHATNPKQTVIDVLDAIKSINKEPEQKTA